MSVQGIYGGKLESPAKMRVRAMGYVSIGRQLWTTAHVVIASKDCGDIKFLLSMGVSPTLIVACDVDPKAREAAAQYGVVISPHPRIEDTVEWAYSMGYNIGSVNIDLCETMLNCTPVVASVHATIRRLGIKCVVMYTFARHRDATVLHTFPYLSPEGARLAYMCAAGVPGPTIMDGYQSYTWSSIGSPMGFYMWKVSGKRGRKAGYMCHACHEMGDHPSKHRKVCKGGEQ